MSTAVAGLDAQVRAFIERMNQGMPRQKVLSFAAQFSRLATPLPRREVHNDFLIVQGQADKVANSVLVSGDPTKLEVFAQAKAFLELAKVEVDFARAWRYVNWADTLLILVVPDPDLENQEKRLRTWDESLPRKFKDEVQGTPEWKELERLRQAPHPAPQPAAPIDRMLLFRLQQVRSQLWNEANNQISFARSLWLSLGFSGLVSLGVAVFLAEWANLYWSNSVVSLGRFFFAAFFGSFGGALSALLKAQDIDIRIPSYQLIQAHLFVRVVIGAAGSFVIFLLILASGPTNALRDLVILDAFAFISVAIASGFSERLFVEALGKLAENLRSVGPSSIGG